MRRRRQWLLGGEKAEEERRGKSSRDEGNEEKGERCKVHGIVGPLKHNVLSYSTFQRKYKCESCIILNVFLSMEGLLTFGIGPNISMFLCTYFRTSEVLPYGQNFL